MKNFRGEQCGNQWKAIHGHRPKGSKSKTYGSWIAMHSRCNDKSNKNYGGKGVSVCARWSDFRLFLEDMGERPKNHTLDRVDPQGNYEPGNCRWASSKEQARNKGCSLRITFKGESVHIQDLIDIYGIPETTIYRRYHQGLRDDDLISRSHRGRMRVGSLSPSSKLCENDVVQIKKMLSEGIGPSKIAEIFGVKQPTISNIKSGITWAHVSLNNAIVTPNEDDRRDGSNK